MSRSEAPRGRVPYARAGQAARSVLRRAHGIQIANSERSQAKSRGLRPIELKVLNSVVTLTATYSKISDYVYLAEIAAIAYGVEESEPWQWEKARKALKVLAAHGLVEYEPPTGRPNEGTGRPAYFVALISEETQPQAGLGSPEEKAAPPRKEGSPASVGNAAPPRVERQPRLGGPTEKITEKITEKDNREDLAVQTPPSREGPGDSDRSAVSAPESVGEPLGRPLDGRAYAREKAKPPLPSWEMPLKDPNDPQACSKPECLERRIAGADLCDAHYWERQTNQCGAHRCLEESVHQVEAQGRVIRRCEKHYRDLLDGVASGPESAESGVDDQPSAAEPSKTADPSGRPRVNAGGTARCWNCDEPTGAVYPCPVCGYDHYAEVPVRAPDEPFPALSLDDLRAGRSAE